MLRAVKGWMKQRWPRLHLRTIVFATLFTVAALPGIAAMFLRVYENALVRQTEGELAAQAAVLAAVAEAGWPGAGWAGAEPTSPPAPAQMRSDRYGSTPDDLAMIDLSSTDILPARPSPEPAPRSADPAAQAMAQALAPVLARSLQGTEAEVLVLDGSGLIAAPGAGQSLARLPEVQAALTGQPATVLRRAPAYRMRESLEWLSRGAGVDVHHARPIMAQGKAVGVLLLAHPARNLFAGLYADRGKIAFGILAIFGVLIVLSGVLSRGIVRPVEELGRATRALGSGGAGVPEPPRTAAIEIQGLYADFARMAEAIERRSRYLRDFAHAVSHEFKTPLAGIRGALELLADHSDTMTPEERRRFIANADADAARLSVLTSRLLDLARADLGTAEPAARTNVAAVLTRIAAERGDQAIALETALPADLPPAPLPEASFDAIANTLVENSRQAGARVICFAGAVEDGALRLTVTDDGPGIPPADAARIFEPFFTTRRATGGSGLGLPIMRSLIEAAGGSVAIAESTAGARFVIDLPLGQA